MRFSTFAVLLSSALLWVSGVVASPAPKAAPIPQSGYQTDQCALKGYDQKCCTVFDGHGRQSKHLCNKDEKCCGQGCCPESWTCKKGKCHRPKSSTKSTATLTNTPPCYGCSSTSFTSSEVTDTTYTFTGPSSTNGTTATSRPSSGGSPSTSFSQTGTGGSSSSLTTSNSTTGQSSSSETSSTSPTSSNSEGSTSTTDSSIPSSSTSEALPSTNSNGQTIITNSGVTFTIPTGQTTPIVITSGDQTLTFTPSPSTDLPGNGTTSETGSDHPTTSTTANSPSTNSEGQTIVTSSGATFTIPTGISTPVVITSGDQTLTFTPSPSGSSDPSSTIQLPPPTTDSAGQTIVTSSGATFTIPTGLSTPVVITSGDQTLTFTPSPSSTTQGPPPTTNSAGQTIVTSSGATFTIPTGISTPVVITSGDQTLTFTPSPTTSPSGSDTTSVSTSPPETSPSTDSIGETIISNSGATFTIPTGISTPITITSNDQTLTFTPPSSTLSSTSGSETTFINTDSQTVISNTDGAVTLPTGITTPFTTSVGSQTFTFVPTDFSSSSSSSSSDTTIPPPPLTTTISGGQTIISDSSGVITIPTGISTPITLTNSNGEVTTFNPGPITSLPSSTTSSSSTAAGFIIPVTTPVNEPQPTDDGTIIPCTLWFFNICIRWDDFNIFGWHIVLPPGIRPPGPPPPFSIDPSASFTIGITGTLPDWPGLTIGPDHLPTYSPTTSPTSCETQTAELCVTRTSYGVSNSGGVTVTTTSQVLSTCATVFGCNAQDASATETTTGGCTSATTATNIWLSCPGTASTSCSTTSTDVTSGCSVTPTTVTCGLLTPTGIIDDPACSAPTGTFVVYPENGGDTSSVNAITTQLGTYVDDPSQIYTSNTEDLGVIFWRLSMTEAQANEMRKFAGVASVNLYLPCDNECDDPTSAIVYQNAVEQLQFVSWPNSRGVDIAAMNGRYYFDESNGEGIPVYIVDTGVNRNHPEVARANSRIRFLHVGRDVGLEPGDPQPQDDSQTDAAGVLTFGGAHGTAMLSLVAGDTVGVAKSADLIAVRLPRRSSIGGGYTPDDFLEALEQVSRDLEQGSSTTKAVVLMAHHFLPEKFVRKDLSGTWIRDPTTGQYIYDFQGWETNLVRLLNNLVGKGALLVTGSGNNAHQIIEGWPARLGNPSYAGHISSLLVAGALASNGQRWWPNTNNEIGAGLPNMCAPGWDVKAADGNQARWTQYDPIRSWSQSEMNYKKSNGTSDAAAMTAGIGAYFLKLAELGQLFNDDLTPVDTRPDGMKTFIINEAWSRIARYERFADDGTGIVCKGIWNTANLAQNICPWNPNPPAAMFARQEGDSCEIPLPSSTSASSSSTSSTTRSTSEPPFPTLTSSTAISTPSGSSCSVTTTAQQCNGSGGQSVCVSITTCASWVATTTNSPTTTTNSPTPTTSEAPLYTSSTVCNNEADFPGHADISADAQSNLAEDFCNDHNVDMYPGDAAQSQVLQDGDDINYEYRIEWKSDDCRPEGYDHQNTYSPQMDGAGISCPIVMRAAYSTCTTNGGVGGYIDVGCLRYRFIGGK